MTQAIQMLGISHTGKVRESNEDAFQIVADAGLVVVSDGMGGQQAGEIASRIVVEALPTMLAAGLAGIRKRCATAVGELMVRAIATLGKMVFEESREIPQAAGLGTTVVAALGVDESLVLAHLGDSRAYLLRHGALERLTADHTIAELLLGAGAISKRECRQHPGQHVLRRYVGMEDCPAADCGILHVQPGDRVLLCTDGLTGMLDERTIGQVLLDTPERRAACERLVDLANEAGGKDNITVVIADVPGDGKERNRPARVTVRRSIGRSLQRLDATGQSGAHEPDESGAEQSNDE